MNAYFGPRRANIPHVTPNYGPGKSNFWMDCYRQTCFFLEKMARIQGKLEKSGQEVMYSSKCLNSNYIEFFGYGTCEKLILTSG